VLPVDCSLFFPVNRSSFCHSLVRCTVSMPILFSAVICHGYFHCSLSAEAYLQSACCLSSCHLRQLHSPLAVLHCGVTNAHATSLFCFRYHSQCHCSLQHCITVFLHADITAPPFTSPAAITAAAVTALMMASCECRRCLHGCRQVDCWLIKCPPVKVSHWLLLFLMFPAPRHCQRSCHAVESLLPSHHHRRCHRSCIIAIASLFLHHQSLIAIALPLLQSSSHCAIVTVPLLPGHHCHAIAFMSLLLLCHCQSCIIAIADGCFVAHHCCLIVAAPLLYHHHNTSSLLCPCHLWMIPALLS